MVTVTAFDGVASKSQDVSIDGDERTDEFGSVSLTQRTPQEGIAITARLSDEDGGINGRQVAVVQGRNGPPIAAIDGLQLRP